VTTKRPKTTRLRERDSAVGRSLVESSLDHLDQGLSVFDKDLKLVLFNRHFPRLLDFPPELARVGASLAEFFRYNAERGEYGPGDIEEQIKARVELARSFEPHSFDRVRPDGTVLEIRGNPLPEGGFISTYTDITARRRSEAALRESEERFRLIIETAPMGMHIYQLRDDDALIFTGANPAADRILKVDNQQFVGMEIEEAFPPLTESVLPREFRKVIHQGTTWQCDGFQYDDGRIAGVFDVHAFRTSPATMVCAFIDVTDRARAEEELKKLSRAVEQSPASVMITRRSGEIEYVNPKFCEVTGYSLDEVRDKDPRLLRSGKTPTATYRELWETVLSGREWRGELLNKRKTGEDFWEYASISPIKAPDDSITHFVAVKEDITTRKRYEDKLLHQANYDGLTELPNRLLALDRLSQALTRAMRDGQGVGVMFVDLDRFKKVNDTLGHNAGDDLLRESARRLSGCVRDGDTVARLGGDEFLVILPDLQHPMDSELVADKILAAFQEPFLVAGHWVSSTASIGLSVYPGDSDDPRVLLKNADAAMYYAKDEGRNAYRYFALEMNAQAIKHLQIESRLRHALQRGELHLRYQPILDLATGQLRGAEALLRWNSREMGVVPPDEFISVAEDTGQIVAITDFVLAAACHEARIWSETSDLPLRVAVNVSTRLFRGGGLVSIVNDALRESGIPPGCLELEITESLLMEDVPQTQAILNELTRAGVRIAVDDFGTGYSSLNYLKRFPIGVLKIDRSFVRDVGNDPDDAALVKAILAMSRSLGLEVTGEGIESREHCTFLRENGCDYGQGLYFSDAVPAEAFVELIQRWKQLPVGFT
jgi:diguanylate cyclase (GGDEF)-like protein/PAS domain S-box-containing protein